MVIGCGYSLASTGSALLYRMVRHGIILFIACDYVLFFRDKLSLIASFETAVEILVGINLFHN